MSRTINKLKSNDTVKIDQTLHLSACLPKTN